MTAFEAGLLVILAALIGLLAYAGHRIERLQADLAYLRDHHEYDACVLSIRSILTGYQEARTLREAARDWDSAEEQATIKRLGYTQYKPGGPSMPVLWLNDRADRREREAGL